MVENWFGPFDSFLHVIATGEQRLVLFIENLFCPDTLPRCFPGASTLASWGLAAAERESSLQSRVSFIWESVQRGKVDKGRGGLVSCIHFLQDRSLSLTWVLTHSWPHLFLL
jgi:hypothetical protein